MANFAVQRLNFC